MGGLQHNSGIYHLFNLDLNEVVHILLVELGMSNLTVRKKVHTIVK